MKLDTLSKIKKLCNEYVPEMLYPAGIIGILTSMTGYVDLKRVYKVLYQNSGNEFYKIRYMQLTHSNNWLKMHGYPMRRKTLI